MSAPTVTCQICGRQVVVITANRDFPPDIAKRKLAKLCKADGHKSVPQYRAGVIITGPVVGQATQEGEG